MIQFYIQNGKKNIEEVSERTKNCWINVQPPLNHLELENLANELGIELDSFTSSLDIEERSRYERYDNVKHIILNTPIISGDHTENEGIYITAPIGIILQEGIIITISPVVNPIIEKFIQNRIKNFDLNDSKMFVLLIFEQTVFRFLECLKKLNIKRNLIEQELYNSSRNKELQELLRIEKSLVYFVSSLSSNELLKMKMKRVDLLGIKDIEDYSDLFEDVIIDNSQALEMSNVYTNILSSTMEAYASIVSNNLNSFIHRLTIITIVITLPTLVASLYGMNVELPGQDNPYLFFIIISFSLVLGFLLVWVLKRKKLI